MKAILKGIACISLFAAGCATDDATQTVATEEAPYIAQVNTLSSTGAAVVQHAAYKEVILDGFQAQWVAVQDVRRSKTNDGYERVQVLVKNQTSSSIKTRYRFDWQDANGVVVVDPDHNAWEKLVLIPGDDGVFTSIAPRTDCADFRLRMKYVQE
jgi:uncharacterized protein YcfL